MKRIMMIAAAMAVMLSLLFTVEVRAEDINYALLHNFAYQPQNVQYDLVKKNTNIRVVDQLDWQSPDLYETYAYTRLNVIPGSMYVTGIDIMIKKGNEFALTHEVGHALSVYAHYPYWWCEQPVFTQIWLAERSNCVLLFQGLNDKLEYFACAYDAYIRYPELLKKLCPMTYNYITVVLSYT